MVQQSFMEEDDANPQHLQPPIAPVCCQCSRWKPRKYWSNAISARLSVFIPIVKILRCFHGRAFYPGGLQILYHPKL